MCLLRHYLVPDHSQSAEPDKCPVFTAVLLRHKPTACLSAQSRPRAFYGAVIQAWWGNSCEAPSHSLGPARALNLGKCHQFVNALFPPLLSLLTLCSVACSFYWGSVSGHVVRFQSYTSIKTQHVYCLKYRTYVYTHMPQQHYLQSKINKKTS